MEGMCSLTDFKNPSYWEGDFDGGGGFLEMLQHLVLANRCCRLSQQWKKLMLYSNSIHGSLKARKGPSGEVITQETVLQGRHRRRL